MVFQEKLEQILQKEQIFYNERMSEHTTFKIGGAADIYLRPNKEQLPKIIELLSSQKTPFLIIGNGSNLLVGDKGIRGVVVEVGKNIQNLEKSGTQIIVDAGTLLSKTAMFAVKESLTGLEFASGIPGTIGGAIVMNAGAYGGEMKQVVKSVDVITKTGKIKTLTVEELELSYRHSCIPENEYTVLSATLMLKEGNKEDIIKKIEELKEKRITKQPLNMPSAGSTFKRPEGYFAAKLIMDSGLRGYQVGGAQISEKHCGFVINKQNATATDVCELVQDVKEKVYKEFGIHLETEVKFVGEF